MTLRVGVLAAGIAVGCPQGMVWAQTIRGRVVEEPLGKPVAKALVTLVDSAAIPVRTALTDTAGRFDATVAPGTYMFRVQRGRAEPVSTPPLTVAPGARDLEVTIVLGPGRIVLDTLTVVGEARPYVPARLDDFYARRRRGRGAFLVREEIEARGAPYFTALLGTLPGMRVVRTRTRYGTVRSVRMVGNAGSCEPRLWVDGVLWGPMADSAEGEGVDVMLFPSDLEAVEVYRRASEMPAEFGGSDSMCGVIAAWTRRSPQ